MLRSSTDGSLSFSVALCYRLQVNFQEYIDELRHVYDLYHVTPDNLKNGARYPGNPQVVQDSTYLHDIEKATQEQDPAE
jgi:hypothetical protein